MSFHFTKMHGLGNDFVMLDARKQPIVIDAARARAIADRRTGIGCDQLILLGNSATATVSMRIWNADGSEVGACGNASRCVPVFIGRDCTIETTGGLIEARLDGAGATVDMGIARQQWEQIPLAYPLDTLSLPVGWDELTNPVAINVGNPHLVFFVDDVTRVPLDRLGPQIETDPLFPERINVNICQIETPDRVIMRTWERGAGLTQACGTGACATFAAGRLRGVLASQVTLSLPGGQLLLSEGAGGRLLMRGPAMRVFAGEADL
jgi:diaminopimelate epimerase